MPDDRDARSLRSRLFASVAIALSLASASRSWGLDKQGSAHGGSVEREPSHGVHVEGSGLVGLSLINPSYAARPDNTGLALMRYALHADIDVRGRSLSIPLDVNTFTDRTKQGAWVFSPTELDLIGGVTSTHPLWLGAEGEVGARLEHDRPVDRGGFAQSYVDVRSRLLYSLATAEPRVRRSLAGGDLTGALTLGWFAVNPTYAARPDNSGNALLRYGAHVELGVAHERFALGVDGVAFTDRRRNVLRPSELDVVYEAIGRFKPYEVHLAYERDMPLDQRGLVQSFVYVLLVRHFGGAPPSEAPPPRMPERLP